MSIRTYRDLLEAVKTLPPLPVAVAGGADPRVIDSLKKAREMGFVGRCYLAGPGDAIERILASSEEDPAFYTVIHSETDQAMSAGAVRAVRENGAAILVKGTVKSEATSGPFSIPKPGSGLRRCSPI